MARDKDDLVEVPSIAISRDDVDHYRQNNRRKATPAPEVVLTAPASSSKVSVIMLFVMAVGLALVSFYLYQELQVSKTELAENYRRIELLEKRLSSTDETLNQSGATLQSRIQEMDGEVRKLWDNVWKKSKERLDALDASIKRNEAQQKKLSEALAKLEKDNESGKTALNKLEQRAAEFDKVAVIAKNAQASIDSVQKTSEKQVAKITAAQDEIDSMKSRIKANEEWIRSVNEFRKQVNRDLESLRQQAQGSVPR